MMEYPSTQLYLNSATNIHLLQKIQNRALRFTYNVSWSDFTSTATLHKRAKLPTIKDRLHTLKTKAIQHLHDNHVEENNYEPYYKYDEYSIQTPPHNQKKFEIRNSFRLFSDGNIRT